MYPVREIWLEFFFLELIDDQKQKVQELYYVLTSLKIHYQEDFYVEKIIIDSIVVVLIKFLYYEPAVYTPKKSRRILVYMYRIYISQDSIQPFRKPLQSPATLFLNGTGRFARPIVLLLVRTLLGLDAINHDAPATIIDLVG